MTPTFTSALLVEDEPNLARTLRIALDKMGIPVQVASTLRQAREFLQGKTPPELVLLDRGLPDGDGLELCRELHAAHPAPTILVLTAAGQVEDRVQGLNEGADDYLPKPFSWDELDARIRALGRRRARVAAPAGASSEKWEIDRERLRIRGLQDWVELTPLEFELAARLMGAGGAIVSREDLLREVWGFTLMPKTRTVDFFVGRLRKYFEADPEEPQHFLTVRGAGYRFER